MEESGLGDWKEACGLDQVAKIQAFLEPTYQIKISSDIFRAGSVLTTTGPAPRIYNHEHQKRPA